MAWYWCSAMRIRLSEGRGCGRRRCGDGGTSFLPDRWDGFGSWSGGARRLDPLRMALYILSGLLSTRRAALIGRSCATHPRPRRQPPLHVVFWRGGSVASGSCGGVQPFTVCAGFHEPLDRDVRCRPRHGGVIGALAQRAVALRTTAIAQLVFLSAGSCSATSRGTDIASVASPGPGPRTLVSSRTMAGPKPRQ